MPVQNTILRAKLQLILGQYDEAALTIQNMRDIHMRQPSGMWLDQDIYANEALVYAQIGNIATAKEILLEIRDIEQNGLANFVSALIDFYKQKYAVAEKKLRKLFEDFPAGIQSEPIIVVHVLLASVLFEQHKLHQGYKVMVEAIRQAAPERAIRPFLDYGESAYPLLDLILETENLTLEAQTFVKELMRLFADSDTCRKVSKSDFNKLTVKASITSREQEILCLVNDGYSNRELAKKLTISESTVKTHLSNIYYKLAVNSRVQAVTRAKELELIK